MRRREGSGVTGRRAPWAAAPPGDPTATATLALSPKTGHVYEKKRASSQELCYFESTRMVAGPREQTTKDSELRMATRTEGSLRTRGMLALIGFVGFFIAL